MAVTDSSDTGTGSADGQGHLGPLRRPRAWWHRHLEPEQRRRIMQDLAVSRIEHWVYRFVVMLTLSVVVAVMGLTLDSAAVVIGAMLLAPLMQPVLATGATLSIALFTKALVSFVKVVAATTWCIGIAFALSRLLPDDPLTSEVLARTQPDIKDLVVALAAGAAGAYATVREDVSSSLPGVAVAVALVPPLASVGITLEAGERALAEGALLLYATNLAAIVVASIVVFVSTGFVPPRRLSDNAIRLTLTVVFGLAIVALVAVPLYRASMASIERNTEQKSAEATVDRWLGELSSLNRTVVLATDPDQIVVELRGTEAPPDQESLKTEFAQTFPGYDVFVQWVRTELATTTTLPPPEPSAQLLSEIRVEVEAWLAAGDVPRFEIDDIRLDGSLVRIDAAGTASPPPIGDLVRRLTDLDPALEPALAWTTLATFTDTTAPSPIELTREELRAETQRWADQRGLELRGFAYDGLAVWIDVTGPFEPDIIRLERTLRQLAGSDDLPVEVFYTERRLVTTTTLPPVTVEPN